jgi:hypothetical protein
MQPMLTRAKILMEKALNAPSGTKPTQTYRHGHSRQLGSPAC